jgi:lipopolysaccharide export system protein LptA
MKRFLLAAVFLSLPLSAQDLPRNCDLVFTNTPATRLNLVKLPTGKYNTYSGGGVVGHCAFQNNLLTADSAEYYEDQGLLYLIGSVHYNEPRAKVTAQKMTYYQADDHLLAEGNVVGVFKNGSVMRGPIAEYYRSTPQRPLSRLIAPNHPTLDLVQPDTTGKNQPQTAHVVANQIVMDGDSLVYASGQVVVTRPDITAKGDSGYLDNGREFARLMREPSVVGRGDRPFTLTGGVIDIFSRNRQVQRVVSTPNGHVLSRDLELVSDSIDLRLAENQIERAIAWGPNRARAVSPDREIIADSIDALLPGQRVREVHAVRRAFANSVPDTVTITSSERDWMMGDTIVAVFNPVPAGDSTSRPQVRTIVASGSARSYYQMHSAGAPKNRPGANYVRGRLITALFQMGKVSTVVVTERAAGVYIEPVTDTTVKTTTPGTRPKTPPAKTAPKLPIKR